METTALTHVLSKSTSLCLSCEARIKPLLKGLQSQTLQPPSDAKANG